MVPFHQAGLDQTGPINVQEGHAYILLITCLSTCAVYLDLVANLSADTFILCLCRFAARHGAPGAMYLDNHESFKSASSLLANLCGKDATQIYLRR